MRTIALVLLLILMVPVSGAQDHWMVLSADKADTCSDRAHKGEQVLGCYSLQTEVLQSLARSARKGGPLEVPLPSGSFVLVDWEAEDLENGAVTVHGRPAGQSHATFHLTVLGQTAIGEFQLGDRFFEVRPLRDGGSVLLEVDRAARVVSGQDMVEPLTDIHLPERVDHMGVLRKSGDIQIDVLLLWSEPLVEQLGPEGKAVTQAHVVDYLNRAVAKSGMPNLSFHVVHSETLEWSSTGQIHTDLTLLQRKHDGVLDEVHALRREVGADLVHLFTRDRTGNTCGAAYRTLSAAEYGFGVSVVNECELRTFAHEIGHNLGMGHDSFMAFPETQPFQSWAHGHVDLEGAFYTVMSYDLACFFGATVCSSVPYFSDPDRMLDGVPLGTPDGGSERSANNARVLRENAANRAAYSDMLDVCRATIYKSNTPPVRVHQGKEIYIRIPMSLDVTDPDCTGAPSFGVYLSAPDAESFLISRHRVSLTGTPTFIGFTGTPLDPAPPPGIYQVRLVDDTTGGSYVLAHEVEILANPDFVGTDGLPTRSQLVSVYPNPFNPRATLTFASDGTQPVSVRVVDLLGRDRLLLSEGRVYDSGVHSLVIESTTLASGAYLVLLESGGRVESTPILVMR